ncbi:hypothetical protein C7B76_02330 [filamentous cyanobacterium CCP2]|nr:hypothetical protein C7B76_02330 [filamentous cyanobacterium CCP2]
MTHPPSQSIGLAELIQQVKKELLSTVPGQSSDAPILFVESVELELQVTVSREGSGGVKIDVLAVGGGELGGTLKRENVHTVKVSLSPLFDKERLMEFYQTLHSDKVPTTVKQSLEALLKGEEGNLSNQF